MHCQEFLRGGQVWVQGVRWWQLSDNVVEGVIGFSGLFGVLVIDMQSAEDILESLAGILLHPYIRFNAP